VVLANEITLGQCLANLLSNALKFVGPGVRPNVRFWADKRGDYFRLWVEDNGLGIPTDQHERVFRVFERLHGARYPGTGIGLSIVRKGIERMGGKVGLESKPGTGTRFWVELPKANI
jgi:signal transduction histidine kinase